MSTPEPPETSTPDPSEDAPTRPDGPGRRPGKRDMHIDDDDAPPPEN